MPRRQRSSGLDGLINLHKPCGISSAKVLYRVRAITGQRKSGHAGTLDPAAEGVLLLCLGKATKLVERLMALPKTYRAEARLDVTSESFDSDRALVPVEVDSIPSRAAVQAALSRFEGTIEQVPPMVSAIKIGGRPAYWHERQGETIELKARPVTIYHLSLLSYDWPRLSFELHCGRGTYVRSLIRDLGEALGTGGCLTALSRTAVGPFTLQDAWTVASIEERPTHEYVRPLEDVEALLAAPSTHK